MQALGLTVFEQKLTELVMGFSYPPAYFELGLMLNSLLKKARLTEPKFRARFLKACRRGLVAPLDQEQLSIGFRDRRYRITKIGRRCIADFQIATGGSHDFYSGFDGTSKGLDKYMPKAAGYKLDKKTVTRADAFSIHNKNPNRTRTAE